MTKRDSGTVYFPSTQSRAVYENKEGRTRILPAVIRSPFNLLGCSGIAFEVATNTDEHYVFTAHGKRAARKLLEYFAISDVQALQGKNVRAYVNRRAYLGTTVIGLEKIANGSQE